MRPQDITAVMIKKVGTEEILALLKMQRDIQIKLLRKLT
jgi:hypothetical protein